MRRACWFSRRWDAAQQAGNAIAIHFVSLLFKWASEDFVRSEAGSGSQGHGLLCDSSALNLAVDAELPSCTRNMERNGYCLALSASSSHPSEVKQSLSIAVAVSIPSALAIRRQPALDIRRTVDDGIRRGTRLGQFAGEVRGLVGAARACVHCQLRIGAEWARTVGDAVPDAGRIDPVGRFAIFHPLLQRA